MRPRAPFAILAAALALGASGATADPTGQYIYITPTAGFAVFDGDLRFPTQSLQDGGYWGARAGYQWRPWLGVEAAGGFAPSRENAAGGTDISFWHASGNLVLSAYNGLLGNPYVSLGGGTSRLSPSDSKAQINVPGAPAGDVTQGNAEFAAGWNWWVTDHLGVRLEGRDIAWLGKQNTNKVLSHTITTAVAVTYALGSKPRDTDGDGVPDRADRCPATPKGATVDASGCPHDSDGDGVLDGLDRCPGTPKGATVDATGCPHDADGDGVWDGLDTCADTPKGATVDSAGCPHDSDNDGVLDGIDQCPDTPKGAKVDARGCPIDSDGDGVPDGLDQCPDTAPGVGVDSTGCSPGLHEHEQELMDTGKIRLGGVRFVDATAAPTPESLRLLDGLGDLFTKWPTLRIEIGGHTDPQRTKKLSEALSQSRADTVRTYLLQRFPTLKPEQFVTKGYGADRPIAGNDTEAGRTLNRRVEFVVLNRDALLQEIQRRTKPAAPDTTKAPEAPH